MKTAKNTTKARLSKPARIAVIATAILLLAAIVFGIVWTNLDHSFRYDRIDLAPFFPDGKIPDFEDVTTLPLRVETTKSATDIDSQIATNVATLLKDTGNTHLTYESDITAGLPEGFRDTVYLYYSVGSVTKENGEEKITPLISNLKYENEGAATSGMLGTNDLNELLEEFLVQYPKIGHGDPYKAGTAVKRVVDEKDISGADFYDYTRVLDIEVTYKEKPEDETSKSYLTLTDFHYQPNEVGESNRYYRGESVILVEDPAKNETAKVDSSVKKIDPKLIEAITTAAKSLTTVGGEPAEGTADYKIDTTSATYAVTYKVTLKSAFLAEQHKATIDLDEDENFIGMSFSYKDDAGTTKTISEGKLAIAVTVEKVAAPSKDLVLELVDGNTAFTAPTEEAISTHGEAAAYANAYIAFIRADEIRKAEEEIKANAATYAETLRAELWETLVERYCDLMVIPEGFEEYDRFYNDTLAYHKAMYESGSVSITTYPSLEEYILLSVYAEEFDTSEEKAEVKKMDKTSQEKKIEELVSKDVREAIFEKVLIFALGEYYGLEVTGGEIRDYKNELYEQNLAYWVDVLEDSSSTSMSAGEIKVMAKDYAKEQISSYTKTFYRENVMLREVKASIIPDATEYKGSVTFVLKEGAAS
ncbi:MAG: hypothetical protein J6V07_01075 [Clostridia bacterium]|nr:hypothetical protein [Clostridia bacterium]